MIYNFEIISSISSNIFYLTDKVIITALTYIKFFVFLIAHLFKVYLYLHKKLWIRRAKFSITKNSRTTFSIFISSDIIISNLKTSRLTLG